MKVLIYKRTHKGDPDDKGIFGIQDCMGQIRNWDFDAVIGIGGKVPWKEESQIKQKINWIGIEPNKRKSKTKRGDYVVFSHFALYEENGQVIESNYPNLFEYMYGSRKRFDMSSNLPQNVYQEVLEILNSIKSYPPSNEYEIKDFENMESESFFHSKNAICYKGEMQCELSISSDLNCKK